MELLYWIPLLNWMTTKGGIDPARVVAVSRGGAEAWYAEVAGGYLDVLDHYSPAEIRLWHEDRLSHPDTESHISRRDHDRDAFKLARETRVGENARVAAPDPDAPPFRPALGMGRFRDGDRERTRSSAPLPSAGRGEPGPARVLPGGEGVLQSVLPATRAKTARRSSAVITRSPSRRAVVLMRGGEEAGGHEPYMPPRVLPVHDMSPTGSSPGTTSRSQTQIVRGARALISTYGGFSFLGPYTGTPTLALYSHPQLSTPCISTRSSALPGASAREERLYRARHVGTLRGPTE